MIERNYLNNTWIELSEAAYKHNLAYFRKLTGPDTEISVVVKANAYGHGWQSIARLAVLHGGHSFCVHSLDEALKLRRAGFHQNILIMGPIPQERLPEAIGENVRLAVYNRETVLRLDELTRAANKLARVHLKLETGTYRQGIDLKDLPWFLERLKQTQNVMLEAVYTHFANIEDTTNHDYAEYQRYCLGQFVKIVKDAGYPVLKKHAACTAAALLFPDTHYDMIRLGLGQYGLWPSRETMVSFQEKQKKKSHNVLRPVLTWKTRIVQIKPVPADNTIGYGRSYQTTRDSKIAVLPVGYSDGYDRRLSNQGHVLIRGKRAPVRGRICMNLIMVDITDIPDAQLDDEVVLIGKQGHQQIQAETLADLCGTINYEIVSRLNNEIPRIIVR